MTAKTVVVICAHTDDEALGCGGTLARHSQNGDNVYAIFLADGVTSRPGSTTEELASRQAAADKASQMLGITQSFYLGFCDNQLDSLPLLSIVQAIENILKTIQPEIVYTHHIGDLNIDHRVTHQAVMTACRPLPGSSIKQIYSFEVLSSTEWQTPGYLPFIPTAFVDISDLWSVKESALLCYQAEMRQEPHSRSIQNVLNLARLRGNSVGLPLAEAFMLIRHIQS